MFNNDGGLKGKVVNLKERIIRLDLTDLEKLLKEQGKVKQNEFLNDAHVEPNELVIRVLAEDKK